MTASSSTHLHWNPMTALDAVMDGLDVETYLVCGSEREGKDLALRLGHELNLGEVDIMFCEFDGYGVRVRLRKYIHRPGDPYRWLMASRDKDVKA